METPPMVVGYLCWSGTRPYLPCSRFVRSRARDAFSFPAYIFPTRSGRCLASLMGLGSCSAHTWGGGWGAPPGYLYHPPSDACWRMSASYSTCERTLDRRVRVRGITFLTAGSSHRRPRFGILSGWPPANSSRLQDLSCACGGVVPSLISWWYQLHTPGMGSAFGVSPCTCPPSPFTSAPWPPPTSPPVMRRVGISLCVTWQHWPPGHTFWRGQLGRSLRAAASPGCMIRPCNCWHRRLPGTTQRSIPTHHEPPSDSVMSWPARFWWRYPPTQWAALEISVRPTLYPL